MQSMALVTLMKLSVKLSGLAKTRGLKPAEIARRSGVSHTAAGKWLKEEPAPHLSQAAATLTGLAACGSCFLTAALLSVIVDAGRKLHEIAASLRDRPL